MVLELRNATKTFGEGNTLVEAMKETNFTVERGELVAVIGPSGSGKSTFLTVAGGLQSPTDGQVMINGKEMSKLTEKQRSKIRLQEIGFILQGSNLVPFLTVDEQLELLNKVKKDNMSKVERHKLYEDLGITKLHKNYPSDLSGGERQRVAIAKALFSKPAILLADEPTASLDSDRAFEVMELLRNETKSNQTATIVVTHDVRLMKYVDKVYKMTDGVLRLESTAEAEHQEAQPDTDGATHNETQTITLM